MNLRAVQAAKHARKVLEECANVKQNENVLVVTDTKNFEVGEVFANAAAAVGAEVVLAVMTPMKYHYQRPPKPVVSAAKVADVVIGAASTFFEAHNVDAVDILKAGARVYGFGGGTLELLSSDSFEADFVGIHSLVERIVELEGMAKKVEVSAPGGTNMTFEVGRKGHVTSGVVSKPGDFGFGPGVEANMSPMEGTAEGVIVGDASITPYWSPMGEPARATVKNGKIVSIEGGKQAQEWKQFLTKAQDDNVYNIAQFAIGLNPFCKITGIGAGLDDEGVYTTDHFGTGTSILLGGKVVAPFHFDLVFWKGTVKFDGKVIQKDGLLVPDAIGFTPARLKELNFRVLEG